MRNAKRNCWSDLLFWVYLTFTFEAVSFSSINGTTGDNLSLETPPTGATGGSVVLGFQVDAAAGYPVDIHLVYEVTSTSPILGELDSTYSPHNMGIHH